MQQKLWIVHTEYNKIFYHTDRYIEQTQAILNATEDMGITSY